MRKKLPLLLLAVLPMLTFAQSAKSKISVHPKKQSVTAKAKADLAYAPAAYCTPALDCTDGDLISNVTFAGINNTTTCSPAGYGDYTSISNTTTLLAGQTYPIAVTVGDGWPNENVSVWIDYNKNDIFDASEFTYVGNVNTVASGLTVTGNIPIVAGTANGNYRMRVRVAADGANSDDNTLACDEDQGYGETEDYTLVIGAPAPTGCLTATNNQWPTATFTPNCNGANANITTAAYLNEYSKVNLVAGTAYTFSTSNSAYFITIGNEAGTEVLASGTGSVVYTPTVSGVVRFYSHLSSNCDGGSTIHARIVKCGTPPPPPVEPDYGCDQTYTGVPDTAHNMTKNLAAATYMVANDFFVPKESGTYKLQSVKFDIVSQAAAGASDITSYDLKILADSGSNTPGSTVMTTLTGVTPTNVLTLPGTFATLPTYRITLDLGNFELPVNAAADTKYWVAITGTSASQTSFYWIGSIYNEGWLTSSDYQSSDSGATWVQGASTATPGVHYEGMMMIDAECATAAVNEAGTKEVSFYPNPVKDFLTISSKKTIETVHVYNIAGQKIPVSSKLVNGKLDMSRMAPGTYIISTILQGGKNESFKVVKK
ncbi:GEVED domain-containing protein [Kaistella faecalis]|uniref:GEVED domain-containing protein n=1 Tax=Kaistella faecalis TaxID=2852098 RepID=UPI001C481506|nr:GEVED domain-containing protein [Chryseobacterium faecale]UFK96976.1 T9SS type A sorting domain-containing protein [Chryseobacterium faecale]